jgi:PAS domain S-box-containing protein
MTNLDVSPDVARLQRELEREQEARTLAESQLESKSRELQQAGLILRESTAALREQLERSAAVLRHAAEGILTFDAAGRVESLNPAAERIFGYQASAAIGLSYEVLFRMHLPTGASFDEWTDAHKSHQQPIGTAHPMGVRSDGTEFPVDIVTSCVDLGDKQLVTAIVRDITRRRELELQLGHAQKMESIGQLAAGIAHEINTPIQYVGDNCRFLRDVFADLDHLIMAYGELGRAAAENQPVDMALQQVHELAKKIDLGFLRTEIPSAIEQSIEGTERVAQIVRAMKDFSHPGGHEKSAVNLNAAIESTIIVCRNEWKYVADVETDFDPKLPLVPCLPGEFNQTILNLVVNAAHAIRDKLGEQSMEKGVIGISSRADGDWVEFRVSDSGTGIPDAVREKIFDPFFTTKGVGRGTGQGLAIAYSAIVDRHGGEIKVESEVGMGTTFVLRLPVHPSDSPASVGGQS